MIAVGLVAAGLALLLIETVVTVLVCRLPGVNTLEETVTK